MDGELNNLYFDNTKTTFTPNPNNIATSDELEASALYQTKMGTNYSKSKNIMRAFNITGVSLILTAAAIRTGSFISNVYVLNPPSVSFATCQVKDHTFEAEFTISNPNGYEIYYYLTVNGEEILKEDCKEEKTYNVSYSHLQANDEGSFYIQFTNRVDYKKIIEKYDFKVEE